MKEIMMTFMPVSGHLKRMRMPAKKMKEVQFYNDSLVLRQKDIRNNYKRDARRQTQTHTTHEMVIFLGGTALSYFVQL